MDGSQVDVMARRLAAGVPAFEIITDNERLARSSGSGSSLGTPPRTPFLEEVFPCECRYRAGKAACVLAADGAADADGAAPRDDDAQACGENSSCINRTLSIECKPEDCPCGSHCRNQRFQKHQFADIEVVETPGKGFGLRTRQDILPGQFIIEYVGEVLSQAQFEARAEEYSAEGRRHFYFMTLQNDQIIDASKKGNLSRFMNHSCNANCATQKWIVNGRLRIGLFALRRIKQGSELTFDYKYIRFGAQAQKCLCGEANCKDYIGVEQKESVRPLPRAPSHDENDDRADFDRLAASSGLEDLQDVTLLVRLLLRTEEPDSIKPLLRTLLNTTSVPLLRRFISLHGLQIINMIWGSHLRDSTLVPILLDLLAVLPVQTRNSLEDACLEEKLRRLAQRQDSQQDLAPKAQDLLDRWAALESVYRIPKAGEPTADAAPCPPPKAASGYSLADSDRYRRPKWPGVVLPSESREEAPPLPHHLHDVHPPKDHPKSRSASMRQKQARGGSPEKIPPAEPPSVWHAAKAPDGRTYYYHEVTRETKWELPRGPEGRREEGGEGQEEAVRKSQSVSAERKHQGDFEQRQKKPSNGPPSTTDTDKRLQEIIERARKAALARSPVPPSTTSPHHPVAAVPLSKDVPEKVRKASKADSHGGAGDPADLWKKLEGRIRDQVSTVVVRFLSRWCRDQIKSPADFKETARKLTHGIVDKELRFLRREQSQPKKLLAELKNGMPKAKRTKIKAYLSNYLRSHGYRVTDDDPSATSASASTVPTPDSSSDTNSRAAVEPGNAGLPGAKS